MPQQHFGMYFPMNLELIMPALKDTGYMESQCENADQ